MLSFSQFLESRGDEYHFHHAETGSKAKVVHSSGVATVTGVETPVEHRGKGGAHAVMKQVTDHLDKHRIRARLVAMAIDDGVETHRLHKLYSRHGFVATSKNEMVREPK